MKLPDAEGEWERVTACDCYCLREKDVVVYKRIQPKAAEDLAQKFIDAYIELAEKNAPISTTELWGRWARLFLDTFQLKEKKDD